jgi:histidinol-phosphate aminotransferase
VPGDEGSFRPAIRKLVPYEPGKPVEELQRELGLERVVKLASNEGSWGPLPSALEAIERSARELNRYPDGGAFRLRGALAERHGVRFEEIAPGAGADGVMDCLAQTLLDPGDEIVCGWPSFSSYVIDAQKMDATPRLVPLRDHRYDLEAMVDAVGPRTKIVYICYPNNPTGTANSRAELDEYFASVPPHVLTVIDQAYFEYVDDSDYTDAVETYFKAGHNVLVVRTFSKIYGLAGLRIGYGVGPEALVHALGKVRRAFDMSTTSQEAALASLDDAAEIERRRRATIEARAELSQILRRHGLEPVGPAVANFVYADLAEDATRLFESLLREGVIIRPLAGFGAPEAVRITVGTVEDHAVLDGALSAVVGGSRQR